MNEENFIEEIECEFCKIYELVILLKKSISFDGYENGVNAGYLFLIENIENSLKKISSHF